MSRKPNDNYGATITLTLDLTLHAPDPAAALNRLITAIDTLATRNLGYIAPIGGGGHLTGDPEILAVTTEGSLDE